MTKVSKVRYGNTRHPMRQREGKHEKLEEVNMSTCSISQIPFSEAIFEYPYGGKFTLII